MSPSIFRAARFERIRCAIARLLFRISLGAGRVSTATAPQGHPWQLLTKSTLEDLSDLSTTTLRAREATGAPAPKVKRSHWKLAIATYLVLSQFVVFLPGIVLIPNGPKLHPFQAVGLTDDPVVAPRIRVYITDTRSRLEPIEQSLSASA